MDAFEHDDPIFKLNTKDILKFMENKYYDKTMHEFQNFNKII